MRITFAVDREVKRLVEEFLLVNSDHSSRMSIYDVTNYLLLKGMRDLINNKGYREGVLASEYFSENGSSIDSYFDKEKK